MPIDTKAAQARRPDYIYDPAAWLADQQARFPPHVVEQNRIQRAYGLTEFTGDPLFLGDSNDPTTIPRRLLGRDHPFNSLSPALAGGAAVPALGAGQDAVMQQQTIANLVAALAKSFGNPASEAVLNQLAARQ